MKANFAYLMLPSFSTIRKLSRHIFTDAMGDPDPNSILEAISTVARARAMTQLAKDSGLGRENLYKILSPGSTPCYETIMKIIKALGIKLQAVPAERENKIAV